MRIEKILATIVPTISHAFYLCDCYATMNGVFKREKDACRWQVSRVTNKATMLLLVEFHVLCRET